MGDEQYMREVEDNWVRLNETLKTRQSYEIPWTVFLNSRVYPENLMRLEKNGYVVRSLDTSSAMLTYTGKPLNTS